MNIRVKIFLLMSCLFSSYVVFANSDDNTRSYIDLYYAVISRDTSCVEELTSCANYFEETQDTVWLVRSLLGLSEHEGKDGCYGRAFSHLWKALSYAEAKNNNRLLYGVHTQLSRYFNVFSKNEEAYEHEKAVLKYAKLGCADGSLEEGALVSAYFSLVLFHRKVEEYNVSEQYLDSCYYYAEKNNYDDDQKAYLECERGQVMLRQGKLNSALALFKKSVLTFKRVNPGYLTIIYSYLGKTYEAMGDWRNAELNFRKSIENIAERHAHYDAKSESLGFLAHSLKMQGKYAEAYDILNEAKALGEEIYSTKGMHNQGFLDIRNMYKEEVVERDKIILQRESELHQQKADNLRIRMILVAVLALVIIAALFWYLRYNRRKFRMEQENQQQMRQMEKEKNRALVEMKNKELTSFTLRLIDKDSLITDIISDVKKYAPENKQLLRSVNLETTGRIHLWEEFDKRFVDVNKGFYENLQNRFPDLTPTEIKHCALIKLNFSAKEMAQLLNISINGVNTSRYRIRKKLGLDREDNLAKFIDGI